MSSSELRRQSKRVKTLCAACQERKARFRYRGEVRADRDHTLCFECYRGEVSRARARRMTETPLPLRMGSPFAHLESAFLAVLNEQQLAHRQRMLDCLQTSSVAS